jgi:hypothetical protein
MNLAGSGAVCIGYDIEPEATDEFYQWHNRGMRARRHPRRLRGRRYIAVAGALTYFNLYEAKAPKCWAARIISTG